MIKGEGNAAVDSDVNDLNDDDSIGEEGESSLEEHSSSNEVFDN